MPAAAVWTVNLVALVQSSLLLRHAWEPTPSRDRFGHNELARLEESFNSSLSARFYTSCITTSAECIRRFA
jgi:hypothetical protein